MSDYTAEKIKYYRKAHGWTQEELTEKCKGISLSSIRRYETVGKDNRDPKTEDLAKIAHALEVDPSVFIEPFVSFSCLDVIADDGKTYTIDPSCDVITKDGEVIFKAEFENHKKAGTMTDDDLQSYRDANPKSRVDAAWVTLNEDGRQKAADQVELVAKVPDYQR